MSADILSGKGDPVTEEDRVVIDAFRISLNAVIRAEKELAAWMATSVTVAEYEAGLEHTRQLRDRVPAVYDTMHRRFNDLFRYLTEERGQ